MKGLGDFQALLISPWSCRMIESTAGEQDRIRGLTKRETAHVSPQYFRATCVRGIDRFREWLRVYRATRSRFGRARANAKNLSILGNIFI
jgi:hypothetical protein